MNSSFTYLEVGVNLNGRSIAIATVMVMLEATSFTVKIAGSPFFLSLFVMDGDLELNLTQCRENHRDMAIHLGLLQFM